jgi:hypothetical protein
MLHAFRILGVKNSYISAIGPDIAFLFKKIYIIFVIVMKGSHFNDLEEENELI